MLKFAKYVQVFFHQKNKILFWPLFNDNTDTFLDDHSVSSIDFLMGEQTFPCSHICTIDMGEGLPPIIICIDYCNSRKSRKFVSDGCI